MQNTASKAFKTREVNIGFPIDICFSICRSNVTETKNNFKIN